MNKYLFDVMLERFFDGARVSVAAGSIQVEAETKQVAFVKALRAYLVDHTETNFASVRIDLVRAGDASR